MPIPPTIQEHLKAYASGQTVLQEPTSGNVPQIPFSSIANRLRVHITDKTKIHSTWVSAKSTNKHIPTYAIPATINKFTGINQFKLSPTTTLIVYKLTSCYTYAYISIFNPQTIEDVNDT